MSINIKKIGNAIEVVEKDLKALESMLIVMKARFSRGTITKSILMQDLDKLLEIVRR